MKDILIIDAGGSKTDWSYLKKGSDEIIRIQTSGINPVQHTAEKIKQSIYEAAERLGKVDFDEIHFYGSGCIGTNKESIKNLLSLYFNASLIEIDSDIMAACKALFGNNSGVACIIGTGSNSCLYEDKKIIKQIPSMGYILGDEGSGSALGKGLLNAVFKEQLDLSVREDFFKEFHLTYEEVVKNVYKCPAPASFLASFSFFILNHLNNDGIRNLVKIEFEKFFIRNILPYNTLYEIGFVGSIAWVFKDLLLETAQNYHLKISEILKSPMPKLELYFSERN